MGVRDDYGTSRPVHDCAAVAHVDNHAELRAVVETVEPEVADSTAESCSLPTKFTFHGSYENELEFYAEQDLAAPWAYSHGAYYAANAHDVAADNQYPHDAYYAACAHDVA